ncbi:MAG: Lsm family RNA-binding protein [Nitrososphaeria archaeon]|nr:Lsm family RNA-binding protein [Conexivisphaerales archaeon]
MSSIVEKKYIEELASMIGKKVRVNTDEGEAEGTLVAVDPSLNLILEMKAETTIRIVYSSKSVKKITLLEELFDLKGLADRLNRVFPNMVKLREDIGAIIVMDKIKVTKSGVVEGTGPSAEKAKQVYEAYLQELRAKKE